MILFELHDKNDVLIRALPNAISPVFNYSLADSGAGKFSLLRDDSRNSLLKKGQIVHVYVDGLDVFSWVIEDINTPFSDAGEDLFTYSGRSTKILLDNAVIYPEGWPPDDADPRSVQYGKNIVRNGDFEVDTIVEWTTYPVTDRTISNPVGSGAEIDDKGNSKGKALKIVHATNIAKSIVARQTGNFTFDAQKLDGSSDFRIVLAAKAENPSSDYSVQVCVRWYTLLGVEIGSITDNLYQASTWNKIETTFTTPPNAASYAIELLVGGSGTFYFDLVKLEVIYTDAFPVYPKLATPGVTYGDNLLYNGGFDDAIDYAVPTYWQPADGTTASKLRSVTYEPTFVENILRPEVKTNDIALKIVKGVPENDGLVIYQDIPVVVGQNYHLQAWIGGYLIGAERISGPGSQIWFKRRWLDNSGNTIGAVITDTTRIFFAGTLYKAEFPLIVAPATATKLRVEVWSPAGFTDCMYDNIVVRSGTVQKTSATIGVSKDYIQQRIPDIIKDIITNAKARLGDDFPITLGKLEYNDNYDIVDGVLILKDIRDKQYRFDYVGQSIQELTNGYGDLTMNGLTLNFELQHGQDKSDRITFRQQIDVVKVPDKISSSRNIRTKLIVEGQGDGLNAVTVEVTDPDLTTEFGIKEGFLDRKTVPTFLDLKREGKAAFSSMTQSANAFIVTVSTRVWKPFIDYNVGDIISLDVSHSNIQGKFRIVGLTATPSDGGDIDTVELDLDGAAYDAFVKVIQQQESIADITSTQKFPQGSVSIYQTNGECDVDKTHPYNFKFYVPSTPLFTNQIRLAFQGVPFRHSMKIDTSATTSGSAGSVPERVIVSSGMTSLGTGITSITGTNHKAPIQGNTSDAETSGGPHEMHSHTYTYPDDALPAHSHTLKDLPHTHKTTVPAIPAHSHSIPIQVSYGIFESTSPQNIKISVNGVLIDAALYGYTDTGGDNLEIGRYIKRGWNTVQFSSTQLGRIVCQVIIQCYVNNQLSSL